MCQKYTLKNGVHICSFHTTNDPLFSKNINALLSEGLQSRYLRIIKDFVIA